MAEQTTTLTSKNVPAYVPFKTLKAFIESLSKTAIPPRINRELMPRMSGILQSQLITALRFLDLIDDNSAVHDKLRKLVKAYGTKEWQTTWAAVLKEAYRPITAGLDLDSETGTALRTAFRAKGGAEGDTNDKAVRFFLKAMEDAGVPLSPHFKARRIGVSERKGRIRETTPNAGTFRSRDAIRGGGKPPPPPPKTNHREFPLSPTRSFAVPVDLTPDEVSTIEATLPLLRMYAEQAMKGGQT
jgi:Arc/MetJ family transcription regulator